MLASTPLMPASPSRTYRSVLSSPKLPPPIGPRLPALWQAMQGAPPLAKAFCPVKKARPKAACAASGAGAVAGWGAGAGAGAAGSAWAVPPARPLR